MDIIKSVKEIKKNIWCKNPGIRYVSKHRWSNVKRYNQLS